MKGDWRDALLFEPIGAHVDGTTISSAVTLTPPDGAAKLLIQALVQNIRITFDGTAPTVSLGFQLKAEDPMLLIPLGDDMVVKVIEETATADIQIQWAR